MQNTFNNVCVSMISSEVADAEFVVKREQIDIVDLRKMFYVITLRNYMKLLIHKENRSCSICFSEHEIARSDVQNFEG